MNANSWREVGIDLESMAFTDERRISGRDKKTGDMLYGVLCTYQDEQDQDTSDDDEFAPCQVIRIPKSGKFLLVVSGILGIRFQNPAFGIQNPFAENPFQIVLRAFTRIHATTVMLKRRAQTVQTTQTMHVPY